HVCLLFLFQFLAERGLVALLELFELERVILRALVLDLDRSHQARDAARRLPIEVVEEAVEKPRAIGVTAAGRVLDGLRLGGRDLVRLLLRVDDGALASERDDQRIDARDDVLLAPAGAILE